MLGVKTRSKSAIGEEPNDLTDPVDMAADETKSTTLEDLMTEFRKNQDGNQRIELKLGEIDKKVEISTKDISENLEKYDQEYKDLISKCQAVETTVDGHDSAITEMQDRISQADQENMLLRERVYELEKIARDLSFRDEEARRQNIIIQGISEANYPKTKQAVTELLSTLGVKVSSATVSNIQRIGKLVEGNRKPRLVKVKFLSTMSKQELFKNINKLKDADKWKKYLNRG